MVKSLINDSEGSRLILDDSVQNKQYSKAIDLVKRQYSGAVGGLVRGIGSGWLKEQHGILLSHERIYQHVWADRRTGGDLYTHLRQAHKKRRKKYGAKDKRGQLCNRVSIDQHPDIIDEKSRIGDWAIDTVIGQNHKGALVTIVDRKSKFTLHKGSRPSTQRV